jgi:hypothetical protein
MVDVAKKSVDYNALIDSLNVVEKHTLRSERRKVLKKLSEFIAQQGFEQLAPAILKFSRTLE